jgi:4-methyl-5(b-hydroxyethyl)-thiazole monophosphate biosynthesis
MNALVLLATGFEEIEAIGIIDILRRGNIKTVTASITGALNVTGAHDITVIADTLFENLKLCEYQAIILPGGGPGSLMLKDHEGVCNAVKEYYAHDKLIAAICASPRVFGYLGLLEGKKATCYPGIEPELTGAEVVNAAVKIDGNIITGRGPGAVFDFGLAIIDSLIKNNDVRFKVAKDLLLID